MTASESDSRRAYRLIAAASVAALAIASLYPLWSAAQSKGKLYDDTYITLTYAKNLIAGRGFVFNHPPPTLGTTTPLSAVVYAAAGALVRGADLAALAPYVCALFWIAAAWIVFLFRESFGLRTWEAAVIGLFHLLLGVPAVLGMEGTYFFECFLVLAAGLFLRGWYFAAGVATALLFLSRGEGALVALMLVLWRICRVADLRRENLIPAIRDAAVLSAGFWIVAGAWIAYAMTQFGTFLPHTMPAKMAQAAIQGRHPFGARLYYWLRETELGYPMTLDINRLSLVLFLFAAAGIAYTALRHRRWGFFGVWALVYAAGYALIGVSAYWWYQLPFYYVFLKFAALGFIALIHATARPQDGWADVARLSLRMTGVALLLLFGGLRLYHYATWSYHWRHDFRARAYEGVSAWLNANTRPEDAVAFGEIGQIGYYTENRIVDLWGLASPGIIPHLRDGDLAGGFWEAAPDYYVWIKGDRTWRAIHTDPRFAREYALAVEIPGDPRRDWMHIYRRRPPP